MKIITTSPRLFIREFKIEDAIYYYNLNSEYINLYYINNFLEL